MTETELPPLILFNGDRDAYLNELYTAYLNEVVNENLTFQELPIRYRYDEIDDKGFGFRHMISYGLIEEDRSLDMQRCERIRWIAWVLRNAETSPRVSWWENRRKNNKNVVLWLENDDYVVILSKRKDYYVLLTAYIVYSSRRRVFRRERKEYQQLKG